MCFCFSFREVFFFFLGGGGGLFDVFLFVFWVDFVVF